MLYGDIENGVNIGSGNGLLPGATKPITWTNIDLSSVRSSDNNLRAISQEISRPLRS